MKKLLCSLNINYSFIAACLFLICMSCAEKSNYLPVSQDVLIRKSNPRASRDTDPNHKWHVSHGVGIDSLITYKGNNSIVLEPLNVNSSEVYYLLLRDEIECDSITFTGKFKYENAADASVRIGIRQTKMTQEPPILTTVKWENVTGQKDWTTFRIKTAFLESTEEVQLLIRAEGDIKLWVSACQVSLDDTPVQPRTGFEALKDHRFDQGSGINLDASPRVIENLEVLAKVWGFMKYYHPEVTRGKYNWDYELFRIMPRIAEAAGKEERNTYLSEWIDQFGKVRKVADYTITDPGLYSRIINLDWLYDENLFDKKLINKLDRIKNAERDSTFNYYVVPYMQSLRHYFDREKAYPDITWEDQGYRILTLFRFWNAMEYCFPYVEMTDTKWDEVLTEFLPLFLNPGSKARYNLQLCRLTAHIDDSHGYIEIPSPDFRLTVLERKQYKLSVPVVLTESLDGEIVVQETKTSRLERGDILQSINGEDIYQMINDLYPYVAASNHAGKLHRILPLLLRSEGSPLEITCLRNGKELALKIEDFTQDLNGKNLGKTSRKTWTDYAPGAADIAYIDVGTMSKKTTEDIIMESIDGKGLILDFRKYPNHFLMFELCDQYIACRKDTYSWASQNEKVFPGNYKFLGEGTTGDQNQDYYKGKIAILVDEGTMSQGECLVMMYSKSLQNKVIGSITAGADGNIGYFYLPGNIKFTYTALGWYYPDWGVCQRKGIHIDQEIRPRAGEIKEGRDIWIEQAISYIIED